MKEIKFPTTTQHWICHNEDGSVMSEGVTEPNQVTTTGQPVLEGFDTEELLHNYIAGMGTGMFPEIPDEGEWCEERVYKYGKDKAKCKQAHFRTHYTLEEQPALWTVIKTIGNPCDAEPWNVDNYIAYQEVGYLVKFDNKVWASKLPISHTWIAPALTGDGAISWEFVQDCSK